MSICGALRTDTGKVRAKNEDASGFFPEAAFFIVADGMGGHMGGEVASTLTVETMHVALQETQGEDLTPITTQNGWCSVAGRRLFLALQRANHKVFEKSQQDPSLNGMGTTVAAVLFDRDESVASICHVGDSRVYRIRNHQIECLTEDHSLVQQLLREGKIRPQDVKTSPHRHILTQAVGVGPLVQPTVRLERPETGDIYLLCSDGIHGVIDDDMLLQLTLQNYPDLQKTCDALVNLANERGGRDNSTVILLSYDEGSTVQH
ncbi:MAG: PP2C family serine/threonine-protein phosphatase [Candidatus Binatia bacterium]